MGERDLDSLSGAAAQAAAGVIAAVGLDRRAHAHAAGALATLTIVGSGTASPEPGRACSAYYVEAPELKLVLDCGAAAVHRMADLGVPWAALTHVAISHFHTDHIGGLSMLLFASKWGTRPPRSAPLTIVGPRGTAAVFDRLGDAYGDHVVEPGFELRFIELEPGDRADLRAGWSIAAAKARHTPEALSYRLDRGRPVLGYTGDTGEARDLETFFRGVPTLISECSLPDDQAIDMHMTPSRVAALANGAATRRLIASHVFPVLSRAALPALLRDAGWTGETIVAADGLSLTLGAAPPVGAAAGAESAGRGADRSASTDPQPARAEPRPTRVPLLDLRSQYAQTMADVAAAIGRVVASQQFVLGAEVAAFEHEIADWIGGGSALGVSSGTDALLLALMAYGIGPGDEVVTTAFSFFATAGVIARLGARPVFADVRPDTLNLDPVDAAAKVTAATRAIVPVHLYGRCADMAALLEIGREHGIPIIEDAAQAIGAKDAAGRDAGRIGEIGCFSFFPTKNLGAYGDAGLVTTGDPDLAASLRILRVHGAEPKYVHRVIGGNFRIDALQAAVLRVKLPHLAGWTAARRANADRYRALFADAGSLDRISVPGDEPGHVYNQFVIRTPRRDEMRAALEAAGIGTEIYYPVPLHLQACFERLGYEPGDLPAAEAAARDVLALPIYPELTEAQQATVVRAIARFLDST